MKIGDWVELSDSDLAQWYPECDFSIPYEVLDVDDNNFIRLNVKGDAMSQNHWTYWPSGMWKLSRHGQFKQILKELYEV